MTSIRPTSPAVRLRALWDGLVGSFVRFGIVGAVGVVIDVTVFNILSLGLLGHGWWSDPVGAKVCSTSVAIVCNWLGNRYWTFRHHRHRHIAREFIEFLTASLIGMAVAVSCVWISHNVLGFQSLFADNIAANVVGLALGTGVRFVLYRWWVWRPAAQGRTAADTDLTSSPDLSRTSHGSTLPAAPDRDTSS